MWAQRLVIPEIQGRALEVKAENAFSIFGDRRTILLYDTMLRVSQTHVGSDRK
jgi:hypothetical protein